MGKLNYKHLSSEERDKIAYLRARSRGYLIYDIRRCDPKNDFSDGVVSIMASETGHFRKFDDRHMGVGGLYL